MTRVSEKALLYSQVHVIRSVIDDHAVVADNTDLIDSKIGPYAEVGRRNLLIDSALGEGSYTGSNDVFFGARIGKFCCISWNVGAGGVIMTTRQRVCTQIIIGEKYLESILLQTAAERIVDVKSATPYG